MTIPTPHRARLRDEAGFVLPTAIALVFIVLMIGLVLMQNVDSQTHQTRYETAGDAAFNLAESAIYAEAQQMQTTWPGTNTTYSWATCNQATAPTAGCPGTNLTSMFSSSAGPSFTNPVWTVKVLDDSPASTYANYYSESLVGTAPAYDANGDGRMWIRATATIDGQRRVEVAEMVRYANSISLPKNVVTAGAVDVTNNGLHGGRAVIQAGTGATGQVDMRCTLDSADASTGPGTSDSCANWDASHLNVQPGNAYQTGYDVASGSYQTLTTAQVASLKASAIAAGPGHYYNNGTCPTSEVDGIVFIENAVSCSFTSNWWWNQPPRPPGILVMASGTLEFGGTETFNGIIYMANQGGAVPTTGGPCTSAQDGTTVITLDGSSTINGGIFVDGCGKADLGSNSVNVNFDPNAFQDVTGYATPYLVKDSFRLVSG